MQNTNQYKTKFSDIAKSKGYKVLNPSFNERKNNIDTKLEGHINQKPTVISVDIKKKNGKKNSEWVYIEFKNSKGGEGWVNKGAQFISFETAKGFILVPRKQLVSYLSSSQIVRWDLPYVDKPWFCKYRLFRRPGTVETITQIQIKDLLNVEGSQEWLSL